MARERWAWKSRCAGAQVPSGDPREAVAGFQPVEHGQLAVGPTRPGLELCAPHRVPPVEWLMKVSGAGDTQTVELGGGGQEAGVSVTKCSSPALTDTGVGRRGKQRKSQRILVKAFQGFVEPCLWSSKEHLQAAHLTRLHPSQWPWRVLALPCTHSTTEPCSRPSLSPLQKGEDGEPQTHSQGWRQDGEQAEKPAPRTSPAHVFACVTGQESLRKKFINTLILLRGPHHCVYPQLSPHPHRHPYPHILAQRAPIFPSIFQLLVKF